MGKGDFDGMRKCYAGAALEAFSNLSEAVDLPGVCERLRRRMCDLDEVVIDSVERQGSRAIVNVRIGFAGSKEEVFRLTRMG